MNNEYTVVRMSQERIPDLCRLFLNARNIQYSAAYLRSKLDTGYTGASYVAHLAYSDSHEAVSFFCLYPCILNIDGKMILAAQSADIVTHPLHQRKGLFTILGRETERLASELGIQVVFAFPNENSYPGFVRSLNWNDLGKMQQFIVSGNQHAINKLWRKILMRSRLWSFRISKKLSDLNATAEETEQFFGELRNQAGIRTAEFRKYKAFQNHHVIKWNGCLFWVKLDYTSLFIGDIFGPKEALQNLTVHKISKLAYHLNVSNIIFECTVNHSVRNVFSSANTHREGVFVVGKYLDHPEKKLELRFTGADSDMF
jgi:GNAT superfamily N-acetyltransferase